MNTYTGVSSPEALKTPDMKDLFRAIRDLPGLSWLWTSWNFFGCTSNSALELDCHGPQSLDIQGLGGVVTGMMRMCAMIGLVHSHGSEHVYI